MTLAEASRESTEVPESIKDGSEASIDYITPEGHIISDQLRVRLIQQGRAVVGLLRVEKNLKRYDIVLEIPKESGPQARRELTSGNFEVMRDREVTPMQITPTRINHPVTQEELVVLKAEEVDERYRGIGYYEI